MRLALAVTLILAVGCATSERPDRPVSALPSVPEQAQAQPDASGSATASMLPPGAPLRAALDLAAVELLARRLAAAIPSGEMAAVEQLLELPAGSLRDGSILALAGLDPSRPVLAAIGPLDPAAGPMV